MFVNGYIMFVIIDLGEHKAKILGDEHEAKGEGGKQIASGHRCGG